MLLQRIKQRKKKMIFKIRKKIVNILLGGDGMMAFFLAQNIILDAGVEGGYTFTRVPEVLKPQVKKILEDSGVGYLAK